MPQDFVIELTLRRRGAEAWFDDTFGPQVVAAGGFAALHEDRPASDARDPFINDGDPWPRVMMIGFDTRDSLAAWATRNRDLGGVDLTGVAFEVIRHPVSDPAAARDDAAFRYMVRYFERPDADTFRDHYLATHHIGLGRLPGMRNLVNYKPLPEVALPGFAPSDYLIGNEVGFDDQAAFNRSMESPERSAMRKEFLGGPPSPPSIHFPMLRRRLA